MPGAKDQEWGGLTVAYNGVQFGGSDSPFPSQPPTYQLLQRNIYDEANRVVTHISYILTVKCTFYQSSEGSLSNNLDAIKFRLAKAGEPLELSGIGLGFIEKTSDQIWGPKPKSFDIIAMHGAIAADTVWVVEFNGPPCVVSQSGGRTVFSAVNSESSYVNDFEGQSTRTITGYYEIPQSRSNGVFGANIDSSKGTSKKTLDRVADDLRNGVNVVLPFGFKRETNSWRGNKARNRVDFTIVDVQLPGRPYPIGITKVANDAFEFSTNPFTATQGVATLSATYTVSPKFHPSLAGLHFFALAANKQAEMLARIGATVTESKGAASVFPTRLIVRSGLYDAARTTSFLMQWTTAGCLANILFHSPWAEIPGSNYTLWARSMSDLWGNTGNRDIRDNRDGDIIISVCDQKTTYKTGQQTVSPAGSSSLNPSLLPCPNIPPEASWVNYDVKVRVIRKENTSIWRKMYNAFSSSSRPDGMGTPSPTSTTMTLGKKFDVSDDTETVVAQNGAPTQIILVQAKGMRIQHEAVFPELKSIGGVKVRPADPTELGISGPAGDIERSVVAKFGDCVINGMRGYQFYVATGGYISDYEPMANPTLCATTRESSPNI